MHDLGDGRQTLFVLAPPRLALPAPIYGTAAAGAEADTTQHRVRHVLPSLMEAAERRSEMQHHEMVSKLDALAHRLARLEGAK